MRRSPRRPGGTLGKATPRSGEAGVAAAPGPAFEEELAGGERPSALAAVRRGLRLVLFGGSAYGSRRLCRRSRSSGSGAGRWSWASNSPH